MSVRAQNESWFPDAVSWGMLSCVIAAGLLGNWFIAAGVLALLVINCARPLDFVVGYVMVTGATVFANYQGTEGTLTRQLTPVSVGIVAVLLFYVLAKGHDTFSMPFTTLTWPLVAYLFLSLVNVARGIVAGYPGKFILLELFPILQLGTAFLFANVFDARRDLKTVVFLLAVIAYGSAAYGYETFAELGTHITGVYFEVIPGMAALLFVNLALRSKSLSTSFVWLVLSLPLFLHQFLSFGRGIWLGNLAGFVSSILIFAVGRGRAAWVRGGLILGTFVAAGLLGAFVLAVVYGRSDILLEAGTRFASIGKTELKVDSRANVSRLIEYVHVAGDIRKAPWFGHGLGYAFYVHSRLITEITRLQYWVHENYLLVWLKQGLIGLATFIVMLASAFWMGVRSSRRHQEPEEAAWLAASSAATALMTVFALTDFPFDTVQPMFVVSLFWGGTMAITNRGFLRIRWSNRVPALEPRGA